MYQIYVMTSEDQHCILLYPEVVVVTMTLLTRLAPALPCPALITLTKCRKVPQL